MTEFSKENPWRINNFGFVFVDSIKKEITEYVEEWLIDTSRQEKFQSHEKTFMYQLKELDYEWNLKDKINSTSPNNFKTKEANDEIKNIYKKLEELVVGKVIRSEVINLLPNSRIRTHKDRSDLLYVSRRFHIPILTNKECTFTVEREVFQLESSTLYELNNRKYHSVENSSNENRVHLIIDVLPIQYIGNVEFL
jgi:hypothetical protein